MDFRTFVRIIRFRWKIVAAAVLACLVGAAVITANQTKVYQASATILMALSGATTINEYKEATEASQARVLSYTELANSRTVAQRAIDQLQVPMSADELVRNTKVSYTPESLVFEITVVDSNRQRVAALAGAIADQFVTLVPEVQATVNAEQPPPYAYAQVVERPTVPSSTISPGLKRNLPLGLVVGLLLGVALALIREATDRTVRTCETLGRISGLPTLAELPRPTASKLGLQRGNRERHSAAVFDEAVRGLRTRMLAPGGSAPRSLLVTSPVTGEGVTTTALKLSLSFTEINEKVVLVEGDLHPPVIADLVGVESSVGLADVLTERQTLDDAVHATSHTDLWVLASTEARITDRHFSTGVLARTLEKLCAHFDRVIVDAPPTLATAEAAMLAATVEATVLVVRAGKTTVDEVEAALDNLRAAGGNVVGTVLTNAPVSRHVNAAARAYQATAGGVV